MPSRSLFSSRALALFAGGASLGFAASRLLPPLVAQARPVTGGGDWFDLLRDDHQRFLSLLTDMEQSAGKGTFHRTQLLLRLKRGLAAHAMAEEDVVYPLLNEEADAAAAAEKLYAEHGAIKTHLYALERTMKEEELWIARATALRQLLVDHARQEEDVDFPRLRQLLDQDAEARVARHVRREKAMVL